MRTLRTVATFGLLPVPRLPAAACVPPALTQGSVTAPDAGTCHGDARLLPAATTGGVRGSNRANGRVMSAVQPGAGYGAATTLAVL
jgi:hypothetical protein